MDVGKAESDVLALMCEAGAAVASSMVLVESLTPRAEATGERPARGVSDGGDDAAVVPRRLGRNHVRRHE